MKITYNKNELILHELKNLLGTILITSLSAIAVYLNSNIAIWILGIMYSIGVSILILGCFLLDNPKIRDLITTDESIGKGVINIIYSNDLYKYVLTSIELTVFAYIGLPGLFIISWLSLAFTVLYKSKLKKYFQINEPKSKSEFKDRDRFNDIVNSKNKDKDKKDWKWMEVI